MGGSPGLTCPECGTDARSTRRLRRTRRHWRLATAGVAVVAASSAGALAPKVRRDGWLSVVPTTGLLLAAPDASYDAWATGAHTPHPVNEELERRGAAANLKAWQWSLAVNRLGMIEIPHRWPGGEPLWVRLQLPDWTGLTEMRLTDAAGGEATAGRLYTLDCGTGLPHDDWEGYRQLRAAPDEGRRLRLVAEVRHRVESDWRFVEREKIAPVWTRTITPRIVVANAPEDITTPCADAGLCEAIRAGASIACSLEQRYWRHDGPGLYVWIGLEDPEVDDLALGLRTALLRRGEEIASDETLAKDQRAWGGRIGAAVSAPLTREQYESLSTPAGRAEWSVRITGDAALSLCDFERNRHWAGEIELPLAEAEFDVK